MAESVIGANVTVKGQSIGNVITDMMGGLLMLAQSYCHDYVYRVRFSRKRKFLGREKINLVLKDMRQI